MSIVGQAVLSAFLQVLFDRLASPELLRLATRGGQDQEIFSEFKKWEKTLVRIHAVLDDAEEKQLTNKFVRIWLAELRDLAYDVEDLLDEFTTQISLHHHHHLIKDPKPRNSELKKLILPSCSSSLFPNPSGFMFKFRMESKMKGVGARLQEISSQKNDLDLRENSGGTPRRSEKRLPTTSLVNEGQVFGREKDREAVLEMVMRDYGCDVHNKCCSVIALIGMGGVGKTTLAQLIYNDERLKGSFDMTVWVFVSDDFDVLRVTKTILESVTHGNVVNGCSNLNLLQGRLRDIVTDKKFLLVLDDVWNEDCHKWDALFAPFAGAALGSKILVTTRNEDVASVMGSVAAYRVKELLYDSCLPLFTQIALGKENFDGHPNLKEIGEAIVERCKGLPLAVKTLGSLLRTKLEQDEWDEILRSSIWDLPQERYGILPALRLSYHYLPAPLKQCFAYCSIFPKDYVFLKEELVLLWMGEGFLQQSKGTNRMEKLGEKYFDDLLSRSLFQRSNSNESQFVMHDLINDLAQYVAGEVCFRLEDRSEILQHKSFQKVRHASYTRNRYEVYKKFEVLHKTKFLRTFLPLPVHNATSWQNFHMSRKVLRELLPKLRRVRVLSLNGYCITTLPNTIDRLGHLRYLSLSHTLIKTLPESVCVLRNLQTLLLQSCGALSKLPAGIVNLTNLRHLDVTNTRQLQEMPVHMGKLTNLRTLSKFTVRKFDGSRITELRDMLRLRGRLVITGLHDVGNVFEAGEAGLQYKPDLQELEMEWNHNTEIQNEGGDSKEMDVLDVLQPHKNLKVLKIKFYPGTHFPSWIGDPSFSKLATLTLESCTKCTSLPPLGKLPFLECLCIQGMVGVKRVGIEFYGEVWRPFPSLKTLTFSDMLEWEEWSFTVTEAALDSKFYCLLELQIRNCPKLVQRLPNCLPSLVKLDISKCPLLSEQLPRVPSLCKINLEECNAAILRSVVNVTTLTNLELRSIWSVLSLPKRLLQCSPELKVMNIVNCSELMTLNQVGDQMFQCKLEQLELCNCGKLEELPYGFFNFTSLTNLRIKRCPKLVSFPELGLPSVLKHLVIEECEALKCLPNGMMVHRNSSSSSGSSDVPHLESLEIIKCPSLALFPHGELPTSLKVLKIWDCTQLESLPETILQNTLALERLSFRKYCNLKTLPQYLHCLTCLIELHISYCVGLESFPDRGLPAPDLKRLYVFNCQNLRSLPNYMQSLSSLQHLQISSCSGLASFPDGGLPSNLISLRVHNCENLPLPSEWGLHRLASLKDLTISGGCRSLVSFANEFRLPSSLIYLRIGKLVNLVTLSMALHNLTSLEVLEITECPKLQSLPKEGLPATLSVVEISDCPVLTRRCLKKKGKYRSMLADVPRVQIDEELLQ